VVFFHLHCVFVKFGHDSHRSIPSSVTVNPAGGTKTRVLSQVLSLFVEDLFPYARDKEGHHLLTKIGGGPGCLDFNTLA
jgi:hypothetical protein